MPVRFQLSDETKRILKNQITALAEQIRAVKGQLDNLTKSKANIDRMVAEAQAQHDQLVASRQALLDDVQKDEVG